MERISALSLASKALQPSLEPGRHLAHTCTTSLNQKTHNAKSLFDTGATPEAFIDLSYAQRIQAPLEPLQLPRDLQGFDGKPAVSGPVTHFTRISFKVLEHPGPPVWTTFFITPLSNFDVIIELK